MADSAYDIADAFKAIEDELIKSMIRNMARHKAEETKEGFNWEQWQALQLKALEQYKKRNREKFGDRFGELNHRISELIKTVNTDGQMEQEAKVLEAIKKGFKGQRVSKGMTAEFFKTNDRKLNALIKATTDDMKKAEVAVLRMADDQYRKVIYKAQVYANTGAGTYEKAIDMATKDFVAAGLNCVEYSNGARHTLSDYAEMAIRTAAKRAYLQGEGTMRQTWGVPTVIMNRRMKACPKCLPFQGKVFIDDVWSGGAADGRSPETGKKYPLLSSAIAAGLYHPRCQDSHTTFFEGISTPPSGKITRKQVEAAEEGEREEAKKQNARRQQEKHKRLAETRLDPENKKAEEAKAAMLADGSQESLTERRKRRLEERRRKESPERKITFDERVSDGQKDLLKRLSGEYRTRLQEVTVGAVNAAGDVDISGSKMRLNDRRPHTAIHEFAHTMANSKADQFGLTHDQEFWKEIRAIRRKYRRDVGDDASRWISSYEHGSQSIDEFFAEAFSHAKMRELRIEIPEIYGSDFTYSHQVLEAVNRHFKRERPFKEGQPVDLTALIHDETVFRFIPTIHSSRVVEVMRAEYESWVKSLSDREFHAIRKYTKNSFDDTRPKFYERLNAMLRHEIPEDPKLREYADIISGALKKKPLDSDIICYRRMRSNPFSGMRPGEKVDIPSFFSTSVIQSRALSGEYEIIIFARKGTRGAFLSEEISRFPRQREFLIDKDTRYRILKTKGKKVIVEVVT